MISSEKLLQHYHNNQLYVNGWFQRGTTATCQLSLFALGVSVDMAVMPEDDEELKKSVFHDQFKVKR